MTRTVDPVPGTGVHRIAAVVVAGSIGVSAVQFAGLHNVLPRIIGRAAQGDDRVAVYAVLAALGAAIGLIGGVLLGALSDRSGRRRPWILGGAVLLAVGLIILPSAGTVPGVAATWVLVQVGLCAAGAGLAPLVPDHVPVQRLGLVSGLVGIGIVAGAVLGLGVAALPGTSLRIDATLLAVLAVVLLSPAALAGSHAERRPMPVAGSVRRSYRDFWLAWCTRFTAMLANTLVFGYLLYYLEDEVGVADATGAQFVLVLLAGVALLVTATVGGVISDRRRMRKAPVVVSMVVMAGGVTILASWHTWPATVAAALVFGAGYGLYLAVDQALVTEVLPNPGRTARDIGVVGISTTTPLVVGPLVAAPILTQWGYGGLYLVTAAIALSGILAVRLIRTVA